jgi:asparagine synthase (glutamine-hydrolysing)
MSAIFGILRFDGGDVSTRDLERMGTTLTHRGPDGRNFVAAGPVGLGHCLMRVNAEDRFEAQPIFDAETGISLVADCRIDNREELAGIFCIGAAESSAMPDSAFILRAYKQWGENCAEHLIGDFAFAVWDGAAQKLVLGRDHMGQRTVFYHKGDNFFAFASEIKGLWALADVPRQLLEHIMFRALARYTWSVGRTLYAEILAVPGGTLTAVGPDGTVKTRHYWEPRSNPMHENRDEAYYIGQYRSVLAEAVACRLRRLSGPAALLNSGGFDTAAIAGLAGPVMTAQGRKLISLSWQGAKGRETAYGDIRPWIEACRRVMPHLDIRYVSRPTENPLVDAERRFSIADGPANVNYKVADCLDAEASAAGARVIMDGLGGDYTVNPRGFGALAGHLRRGEFRRFLTELRPHLRETGQTTWRMLKEEFAPWLIPTSVMRWQRRMRRSRPSVWVEFAHRDIFGPAPKKQTKPIAAEQRNKPASFAAQREQIRRVALRKCRGFASGGAIVAANFGLDLTRPFHDKRVVELAFAVPEDLYVKHGLNRYLARRALADIYPTEFQHRGRRNVGIIGDDKAIVEVATPALLNEADRQANDARLASFFNYQVIRRMLQAAPTKDSETLFRKSLALNMLLRARFLEWFDDTNCERGRVPPAMKAQC